MIVIKPNRPLYLTFFALFVTFASDDDDDDDRSDDEGEPETETQLSKDSNVTKWVVCSGNLRYFEELQVWGLQIL